MNSFVSKLKAVFKDETLRKRVGFTIGALIVFRLLAAIPMPGVDTTVLSKLVNSNQFFGFLNIFSGGGLSNFSIVMLGVSPFITASIIIQLLTMMVPSWKALMHDEGEAGRVKLSQRSRLIAPPLAILQGIGFDR
jgi:preprotein translocase subunit SecY